MTIKLKGYASRNSTLEEQVKRSKMDFEEQKKIFLEKSQNDDKYIKALKAELQKAKITDNKENRLWSANLNGEGLQPLKTDYVKRITVLEKEVEKYKQECKRLEQSSMISLNKVN